MATQLEIDRWELFQQRYRILFNKGLDEGLIRPYDAELLNKISSYYYGGMPLSIVLLCNKACNGFCYDRAVFVALGLEDEDYTMVDADVDSIRLNPIYIDENRDGSNPHYSNHCFVVKKEKDGTEWVYDTSAGLVFEKGLYFEMEKPVITSTLDKETVMSMPDYQDYLNSDIEVEKYALPMIIPTYEALVKVGQPYYNDILSKQLEAFKKAVGYDEIKQEIEDDMRRLGLLRDKK